MNYKYYPINIYKLKSDGKNLIREIEKFEGFNVKEIKLNSKQYESLMEGISPSDRNEYKEKMNVCGKTIVKLNS